MKKEGYCINHRFDKCDAARQGEGPGHDISDGEADGPIVGLLVGAMLGDDVG